MQTIIICSEYMRILICTEKLIGNWIKKKILLPSNPSFENISMEKNHTWLIPWPLHDMHTQIYILFMIETLYFHAVNFVLLFVLYFVTLSLWFIFSNSLWYSLSKSIFFICILLIESLFCIVFVEIQSAYVTRYPR